jgi:hypothetical protein
MAKYLLDDEMVDFATFFWNTLQHIKPPLSEHCKNTQGPPLVGPTFCLTFYVLLFLYIYSGIDM